MPNRRLTPQELTDLFAPLINNVRARLAELSGGDSDLLFALRRKLYKELQYLERGKPMNRLQLKALKRGQQNNKCAICGRDLPDKNVALHRIEAMNLYTPENTQLVHNECHYRQQEERRFR